MKYQKQAKIRFFTY